MINIKTLMLALAASMVTLAAHAESPADKGVSKEQFLQRAEKGFHEADADGDGKLSAQERKAAHEKRKANREERREERKERREERKEERQEHKGDHN